jgi:broad specificity phosphatase PhoE
MRIHGEEVGERVEVVVVRHGETAWSRTGRHTSRTDVPLTERGRAQARCVGELLGDRVFDLVLASPRSRALETARLAGLGDIVRSCDDLREWDYGIYEGRTTEEIRARVPGWSVWTHALPEGETLKAVGARADRVIDLVQAAGGPVALFGHGHQLRVLAARWCGLPASDGRLLGLDPATVSVLGYERETPVIRRWNQPCGAESS